MSVPSFFNHLPFEGLYWLFLATVNRAAVNIYVQIFGRHKFILILVNTKEYDCWIMW